jgi:cytochrome c peroxidase
MADRLAPEVLNDHPRRLLRGVGSLLAAFGAALVCLAPLAGTSSAQEAHPKEHVVGPSSLLRPSRPLTWLLPPLPPNLGDAILDKAAAVQLGKAFFWDTQVGSDGTQACASCHFQAGADPRLNNQVSPGLSTVASTFHVGGPNERLTPSDFPFHQLADPDDRNSAVLRDRPDVVGSQGVFTRSYQGLGPTGEAIDRCADTADPVFNVHGANVRQVTGRQAPSVINAIFYGRTFWDGRADTYFNGANPQGVSDQTARVLKAVDGQLQPVKMVFPFAGLASQATGPGLSEVEMSCNGRTWPAVARKMLHLAPLAKQTVDPTDSVLGALATSRGLSIGYADLIRQAFRPEYWSATGSVSVEGHDFTQMEANFALYWGLAIELYESTLISDQTPYDQFLAGQDDALTLEQYEGMVLFNGKAGCMNCHSGALLSNNVSTLTGALSGFSGFENTGVRPMDEDPGVGPVAARIAKDNLLQGAFKTPQLRNVELTGPYFHNGGVATLREVVDFYNRGGDFDSPNLDSVLKRQAAVPREQRLTDEHKHKLISFLLALTDERVRYERAPFDHPELCVPDGQLVAEQSATSDAMRCVPAVGASGGTQALRPFLDLDPYGTSVDQSR